MTDVVVRIDFTESGSLFSLLYLSHKNSLTHWLKLIIGERWLVKQALNIAQ